MISKKIINLKKPYLLFSLAHITHQKTLKNSLLSLQINKFFSSNVIATKKSFFFKYYKIVVCRDLLLKQNLENIMQLTSLNDITLTTTSKTIVNDKKAILPRLAALEILSGQKATWTKAKKSIATFKLRKNMVVGCKVTLRKKVMFSFFEKIIIILLPRMRDYRGLIVKKKKFSTHNFGQFL